GTQRYVPNIAGPSLAGIVLAVYGPAACYMVDAMSWLVMLASLGLLRTKLQEGRGWGSVSLGSLREGFQFVTRHRVILPLMLLYSGEPLFGMAGVLFPCCAWDIWFVGSKVFVMLYAAKAVGSLSAAAMLSFLGPVRRVVRWILIGVGVFGVSTVLSAGSNVF